MGATIKIFFPSLADLIKKYKGDIRTVKDNSLSNFTLIDAKDPEIKPTKDLLSPENLKNLTLEQSRALSCFISSAIGDSLGSHTEFSPFDYYSKINIKHYSDIKEPSPRAKIGQWTDDTSMALCLADSLLENQGNFNGIDIRYRFLLWWHCGYNSGCKGGLSFGLGGNIAQSFRDFHKKQTEMTKKEIKNQDNGNGSLMRLAPVPIFFRNYEIKGLEYAENQSFTTHNGEEASECCKLLTHLIIQLINRKDRKFKEIFDELEKFDTKNPSVKSLACSKKEKFDPNLHPSKFNKTDEDRNWNWKDEKFEISPFRFSLHPGYYASYCMDALALSLHYAYYSTNAYETVLRAVNAGGDSDTVAAITGQIVGAIYGLEKEIMELYEEGVVQWDDWAIAVTAVKLFNFYEKMKSKNKEFNLESKIEELKVEN